jgi:hypothetical protein
MSVFVGRGKCVSELLRLGYRSKGFGPSPHLLHFRNCRLTDPYNTCQRDKAVVAPAPAVAAEPVGLSQSPAGTLSCRR